MESFVGNHAVVQTLADQFTRGAHGHAYLFCGPAGLGKTTLAEQCIRLLLCTSPTPGATPVACNACQSCLAYASGAHPDAHGIERLVREDSENGSGDLKKSISIEQVRLFQASLQTKPVLARFQVGWVFDADALTMEAANALLKTLEEPPAAVVLILVARHTGSLPATLASRCQVMRFRTVPRELIAGWLIERSIPKGTAQRLARLCLGRPGLAWHLATHPQDAELLSERATMFLQLCRQPIVERMLALGKVDNDLEPHEWLDLAALLLRDGLLQVSCRVDDTSGLVNPEQLKGAFQSRSAAWFARVLGEVEQAKLLIASNVQPRLVMENFALAF